MKNNQSLLLLSIAIVSCSASAQLEKDVESFLEAKRQESVNCRTNVETNWVSNPLERKLPFDGYKAPSLEQISNQTKPTAKEKALLLNFVNGLDGCNAIGAEWRRRNVPQELDSLLSYYWSETKYIFADVYAGKITYGDAARKRAALALDWNAKRNVLVESAKAQAAAKEQKSQEAETQRRIVEAQIQQQREAEARRLAYEQQQLERDQAQLNFLRQQAEQTRRQYEETRRQNGINDALNLLQRAAPRAQQPQMITCDTDRFGNGIQTICR